MMLPPIFYFATNTIYKHKLGQGFSTLMSFFKKMSNNFSNIKTMTCTSNVRQ